MSNCHWFFSTCFPQGTCLDTCGARGVNSLGNGEFDETLRIERLNRLFDYKRVPVAKRPVFILCHWYMNDRVSHRADILQVCHVV